ncbi:ARFGEF [Lepeophtheirus salmonis]|uniref:ARFGEF n=1 Tax=Lepeophtheirus salmonis TaxID=72036 RepID=A0A7R8CUX0_LEPSM|nr:ARFGEF [Lepeophtheirus salmonis]CAF2940247.1 ARFGEF [Lepeophtheirus salmonis]
MSHRSAKELMSRMEDKTMLPVLTKYETSSLTCCLEILFEFYVDESSDLNSKLLDILRESFSYYLSMTSKLQKDEWNSLLLVTFNHLYTVNDEKFIQLMPELYNHTCDILSSHISNELKVIICKVMKRVGLCFDIVKKVPTMMMIMDR